MFTYCAGWYQPLSFDAIETIQSTQKEMMEKRVTTLEVRMDQTAQSIDRLDRSITDLRVDMDKRFIHAEEKIDKRFIHFEEKIDKRFIHFEERIDKRFIHFEEKIDKKFARIEDIIDRKFSWSIGIQITTLLAMMAFMGKMAQFY
jgi:uncharacterized coiled-coil protein SlyX